MNITEFTKRMGYVCPGTHCMCRFNLCHKHDDALGHAVVQKISDGGISLTADGMTVRRSPIIIDNGVPLFLPFEEVTEIKVVKDLHILTSPLLELMFFNQTDPTIHSLLKSLQGPLGSMSANPSLN